MQIFRGKSCLYLPLNILTFVPSLTHPPCDLRETKSTGEPVSLSLNLECLYFNPHQNCKEHCIKIIFCLSCSFPSNILCALLRA